MENEIFNKLNAINCNEHTEEKNSLTYLSWCWAWAEVKKLYPDATYSVYRNPLTNLPYDYDPNTGYMCYTSVTIAGQTLPMWLCVMDSTNHALKAEPYTITNKYGKETKVDAATMFDINKTIMRCLTKNLAMFGLGLYIYAGEDLPEGEEAEKPAKKAAPARPAAEPVQAPAAKPVICECCGGEVQPYGNRTAEQMAQIAFERFGKRLCTKCAINEKAKAAQL